MFPEDDKPRVSARQNVDVTIPDANLLAAINDRLGKGRDAPVTAAELEGITQLWARARGISNLSGLEHAVNLTDLDLGYNNLSGQIDFKGWTALRSLYLDGNYITRLVDLELMHNLRTLEVRSNRLTSLSLPTGVQYVEASHNMITTLQTFGGAETRTLHIQHNRLRELDISHLHRLGSLNASDNRITLVGWTADIRYPLEFVSLANNRIESGSELIPRTNTLEHMNASGNVNLGSVNNTFSPRSLKTLLLNDTSVFRLNLNNAHNLEVLEVTYNPETSLRGSTKICSTNDEDIELRGASKLRRLKISITKAASLDGLEDLTSLEEANLFGNCFRSFDGRSLTSLNWVALNFNKLDCNDVRVPDGVIVVCDQDTQTLR